MMLQQCENIFRIIVILHYRYEKIYELKKIQKRLKRIIILTKGTNKVSRTKINCYNIAWLNSINNESIYNELLPELL